MANNYKDKLKSITTFFFDYDGIFTDGTVYHLSNGELARTTYVRDGYAIQLAVKKGFKVVIVTGGKQKSLRDHFNMLGVTDVFLGSVDKSAILTEFASSNAIDLNTSVYMGDDIPDYKPLQLVGLPTCPKDAAPEIKSVASYVSYQNGGHGCVRDIIEQVMKAQGKWMDGQAFEW